MPKTVYYSKKYMQKSKDSDTIPTAELPAVKAVARRVTRIGPVLMISCLAVAILCVLLVPLLLGGAEPVNSATGNGGAVEAAASTVTSYTSGKEALEAAGLEAAALPASLPEGCTLTSCSVVDGGMVEMGISYGRGGMLFRVAAGNEDLTGADYDAYSYTINETVDEITRGYAGVSEKKLSLAVWTDSGYSYALVAENGLETDLMKAIAQSIA